MTPEQKRELLVREKQLARLADGRSPRKPDPEKFCLHCGARLQRKRFKSALESMNVFLRRRYCGIQCARFAPHPGTPGIRSHSRNATQKRIQRLKHGQCERCGAREGKLDLHHKDRDWRNNDPANLETLCGSCHTAEHAQELNEAKRRKRQHP